MNVQRGALLLVPQLQCISSFVFYILCDLVFSPFFSLARTCSAIFLLWRVTRRFGLYYDFFSKPPKRRQDTF